MKSAVFVFVSIARGEDLGEGTLCSVGRWVTFDTTTSRIFFLFGVELGVARAIARVGVPNSYEGASSSLVEEDPADEVLGEGKFGKAVIIGAVAGFAFNTDLPVGVDSTIRREGELDCGGVL